MYISKAHAFTFPLKLIAWPYLASIRKFTLWYRFSATDNCSLIFSWAFLCVAIRFSSWANWLSYIDLMADSSKVLSFRLSESLCSAENGSPSPNRPYLAWYNSCFAFSAYNKSIKFPHIHILTICNKVKSLIIEGSSFAEKLNHPPPPSFPTRKTKLIWKRTVQRWNHRR